MKQKLPREKSSYKNLNLGGVLKIQNYLSNSWPKHSLIGFIITKLSNREHLITDLFDFQIITLSVLRNSYNSRNGNNFILKTLILLASSFSVYHGEDIVKWISIDSTQIQRGRNDCVKDYISTCGRSIRNSNTKLDIFLRNSSTGIRNPYKNFLFGSSDPRRISSRLGNGSSNIRHYYIDNDWEYHSEILKRFAKNEKDQNRKNFLLNPLRDLGKEPAFESSCSLYNKKITRNLQNWGGSDRILVEASSISRESYYLLNSIESCTRKILKNYFQDPKEDRLQTERSSEPFSLRNGLHDPKFFITLEKIMSDSIYRFSRYVSYKALGSATGETGTNPSIDRINSTDLNRTCMDTEEEIVVRDIEEQFVAGSAESFDVDPDKYAFEWMNKDARNVKFLRPVLIQSTLANQSFSSSEQEPKPLWGSLINGDTRYLVSNLFLQRNGKTIKNFLELVRCAPPELLSIEGLQETILDKNFGKIWREAKRAHRKSTTLDYIEVIKLWKIRKDHSNLLSFPPLDSVHSTIRRYLINGGILHRFRRRWNRLLSGVIHPFLPISSTYGKFNTSINCIKLGSNFVDRTNELDVLANAFDKIGNPEWDEKESINDSFVVEATTRECNSGFGDIIIRWINSPNLRNSLLNSYSKNFIEFSSNAYTEKHKLFLDSGDNHARRDTIHDCSETFERITKKVLAPNVEDLARNEPILKVSEWFNEIRNLTVFYYSKSFISHNLSMGMESPDSSVIFSRILDSEDIGRVLNPAQNSVSTDSTDTGFSSLPNRFKEFVNNNLIAGPPANTKSSESTNGVMNNSTELFDGYTPPSKNVPVEPTTNDEVLLAYNYSSNHLNYLWDRQSDNTTERIFTHSEEMDTEICGSAIYPQLLRNSFRHKEFSPTCSTDAIEHLPSWEEAIPAAQSQLCNILSPKTLQTIFDRLFFLFDPFSRSSSRMFSPKTSDVVLSKREVNGIGTAYESLCDKKNLFRFFCSKSEKFINDMPVPNNFGIRRNVSCSKSLVRDEGNNSKIFRSMDRFFTSLYSESGRSESKHLEEYEIPDKVLESTSSSCRYDRFRGSESFARYALFQKYIAWFFTFEWWEYYLHIFVETLQDVFRAIDYRFEHFLNSNIQVAEKNFVKLWDRGKSSCNSNSKWDLRLFVDCDEGASDSIGLDPRSTNNWNSLPWALITLVSLTSLYCQNRLSILIGLDPIDLWERLQTIKYLTDTSRAFRFTRLFYRDKTHLGGAENAAIRSFKDLPRYVRNLRFYLLTRRNFRKWLISYRGLDLPRRKRSLSVQSLITHSRIKRYGFRSYPKEKLLNNELGYRVTRQQGLLYVQYLSQNLKRNLVHHPLHSATKWILFASLQRVILSRRLWQVEKNDSEFREVPVLLGSKLSRSKGILLVGPEETGRSYLIKNLASESCAPLLRISINGLLYNKPDAVTEGWTNILIESLRRLNLVLDLAKRMSPCIIWIPNIHRLDVNRSTQNVESDPTFLLGVLSKHLQIGSKKTRSEDGMITIGSTHIPERVDPALISPNRLDRVINIRLFSNSQRRNQFSVFLSRKNLRVNRKIPYFNEFGSRTMGYNMRDLAALTREVSLLSATRNESFVHTNTTELASHRQILAFTHTNDILNFSHNFGIALYKIGRAIARNIFMKDSATNPLSISNYLCRKKFYYLSKWYLEPAIDESIVKESVILTHALGCLAGAAARDSWFVSEKDSDASIPLDKLIENDFDIASSILENLSIDFPWLGTCKAGSGVATSPAMNFLNILQNGIFSIANENTTDSRNDSHYKSLVSQRKFFRGKNCESRSTVWSPRSWRLSFLRSHSFDWIKRPNDVGFCYNPLFSSRKEYSNNLVVNNPSSQFIGERKEQFIYERILSRIRGRNVQELEFQFRQILLEEQSEILGLLRLWTDYRMDYQSDNKPRLFIGKRILWDPTGLFPQIRHFVFTRREFFVDEEILRRLYVTYGARREREESRSSHRIKRFFVRRGYNKDSMDELSIPWWAQLPTHHEQGIDTLERIEKIGTQLKRPRIFTPVYLYQRWLIENPPEKFSRFEFKTHRQRWIGVTNSLFNDSIVHRTLSESYQYLLRFFLSNGILLDQMAKTLLIKGWLLKDEIEDLIHNNIN
uniref:hypothetical chloroplast RF21 n=1 Tax=Fossombronia foveolata TaxID=56918 RepID=UPI00257EA298|nr:hypothetical chloroplast RF21 [Fossombronia foveolata]WIA67207.1 hypothetical chloroplast RF21 [Fossombronia foveolata]